MGERLPVGREVLEDVRVIEFQVVDDRDLGLVMDELAALVEEGGVVFVALDDEPFAVGEARALREIVRDAADEIARVQAVVLEDPGEQRGRRRFAMRARDHERAFAADEVFAQQFRQRAMAQLVIQHVFRLRIAARDGVADHDEVRLVRQVGLGIAIHHRQFLRGQERSHRLIHILVGPGHGEPFVEQRARGRRHGRAADAHEMDGFDLG